MPDAVAIQHVVRIDFVAAAFRRAHLSTTGNHDAILKCAKSKNAGLKAAATSTSEVLHPRADARSRMELPLVAPGFSPGILHF